MTIDITKGKVRGFVFEKSTGSAASGTLVVLEAEIDDNIWQSVGALAADHAGYVSFSLSHVRRTGRTQVKSLRVRARDVVAAVPPHTSLAAGTPDFVAVVERLADGSRSELPAVQEPDDADRELSPGSFSSATIGVLGDDSACMKSIPGGLAAFDYGVYRVLRLNAEPGTVLAPRGDGAVDAALDREAVLITERLREVTASDNGDRVDVGLPVTELDDMPGRVQLGLILRFIQHWQPLGQCLGDVVYSLPLAPGEARDLAMIDWSRSDSTVRTDDIDSSEQLIHQQHRDRSIEEAINAGLHEHQEGWSFMAGTAGAASASIPINAAKLSVAGDHAIGVGMSSSTGDRNLAAFSQQDLADTITQSTTVLRGLRSTVIVQADQNESNAVQTRSVANHNRCHALTIQYYEVLRTYRVVTEFVGADLALLVPHALVTFDETTALRWRAALERNLLDPALARCFDAIAYRTRCSDTAYDREPAKPPTDPVQTTPSYAATSFTIRLDTGPRETWGSIWVNVAADDGTRRCIFFKANVQDYTLGKPKDDQLDRVLTINSVRTWSVFANTDQVNGIGVDLRTVESVEVEWVETNGEDAWAFSGISVVATAGGKTIPLLVNGKRYFSARPYIQEFKDSGHTHQVWAAPAKAELPSPDPAPPAQPGRGEHHKRDKDADKCCSALLIGHLNDNAAYYSKVVWVGMDATERRLRLTPLLGRRLADSIDDRPLAVSGDQVAFQFNAVGRDDRRLRDLAGAPPAEVRFATVPARGVFAEAELGRCNACEQRDVSRTTEWSSIRPPQITNVQPGPTGDAPPVVVPTSLPTPVVQVVQAPNAPESTGLAAALTLLGKSDVFRDMSGRSDLERLLSGLVTGAVSLTEAKALAQQVKDKQTTGTGTAAARTQGSEPDAARQLDRLDIIRKARSDGLINEADARGAALGVVGGEELPVGGTDPTAPPPLTSRKAWPKLSDSEVLPRVKALAANANLFDQGSVGLCTAAAFFHHVIQRDPVQFEKFADALYGAGMGFLGRLKVAPDADLRDISYAALALKHKGMPPQADWMLMSALRDSENWFFDFEGAPDESVAIRTSAQEMSAWYEDTGLYKKVTYSSDTRPAKIKAITKSASNHVALWIKVALLGDSREGSHMITIEGPLTVNEAADTAKFDYWTWGQPVKTLATSFTALKNNYLGSIVATF